MLKNILFQRVQSILGMFPETRNSDIKLTQKLWSYYFPQFMVNNPNGEMIFIRDLFELPSQDDIKRIRAKIQNEQRRYLPTDIKIMIKRAKNSKEWKTFLGYQPQWKEIHWSDAVQNFLQPKQGALL